MRVLLYAKLLKETETDETIVFLVTFLSLVAFQLGGGGLGPLAPPGYAYGTVPYFPLPGQNPLRTKFIPKMQDFERVLDLNCK